MPTIEQLKRKARDAYESYYAIRDEMDCGAFLAEHVSGRCAEAKNNFNQAMEQLERTDSNAPKGVRL